jgi:3-methyladenine DNA glycosylase AlkD
VVIKQRQSYIPYHVQRATFFTLHAMKTLPKFPANQVLPAVNAEQCLRALGRPEKSRFFQGFFKAGPGQYGEGDQFLGVTVPEVRTVAKRFFGLPITECVKLLQSPYNETRLLALLILVARYKKADAAEKQQVYNTYLANRARVNNWNLVDSSAPYIVGDYLGDKDRAILADLAKSDVLWDRRIAVLATFAFIRNNDFRDALSLSAQLLNDPQDLMHKACGWMLREVGKRDAQALEHFLRQHQRSMPRTMLRYAIERYPPEVRSVVMSGTF